MRFHKKTGKPSSLSERIHKALIRCGGRLYKVALILLALEAVGAFFVFIARHNVHPLDATIGFMLATWIWPLLAANFLIFIGPFLNEMDRLNEATETFEERLLSRLESIEKKLDTLKAEDTLEYTHK